MASCTEHKSGQSKQGLASDWGCPLLYEHPKGCSDIRAVFHLYSAFITLLCPGSLLQVCACVPELDTANTGAVAA